MVNIMIITIIMIIQDSRNWFLYYIPDMKTLVLLLQSLEKVK